MPRAPGRDRSSARGSIAWSVAIVACLAIGCGDEDGASTPIRDQTPSLSERENRLVVAAQGSVASYCRDRARELGGGKPTSASDLERVTAAVEDLAALAQVKPAAETRDGVTVRLALGDIAENLEGTNCDERLVALIDAQLAKLPPG